MYRGTGIYRQAPFAPGEGVDELSIVVIIKMCGFSEIYSSQLVPYRPRTVSTFFLLQSIAFNIFIRNNRV